MRKLMIYFSDHGVIGVVMAVMLGLLMTSGAAATYKLMTGVVAANESQSEALELPDLEEANTVTEPEVAVAENTQPNNVVTPTKMPVKITTTLTPTQKPSSLPPAVQPTKAMTAANSANQCLVTLWGNQYDVTSLRSSHPGGDIFVCGTDMTAVYQSQHGTSLSRMSQYLVAPGSNNTGGTGTTTNTGSSESEYEEEEEEEESEQERYVEDQETEDHETEPTETEHEAEIDD